MGKKKERPRVQEDLSKTYKKPKTRAKTPEPEDD